MKTRATSFLLATLAVVSLVLPVLAAEPEEISQENAVETAEIEEVHSAISAIRLDGEDVQDVEYEFRDGVCYVTVSSFVSLMDSEAMVEEENGVVIVNASTVTEIIPLEQEAEDVETVEMTEDTETADGTMDAEEEDAELTANVVTADLDMTAAAGADYFVANGRYLYAADGLVQVNGRVAAPVRQLARVFNLTVGYDAEREQVLLDRKEDAEPYLAAGASAYDSDTLYWLSRIIHAESGNQPLEGKIAVGNVVMNRVKNPRFPDNIYDVLFQKNQFTPAASGSIYRDPNWESVVAAMLVMDGAEVLPNALFFNGVGARSYASRTRTYVATIGDHAFYK